MARRSSSPARDDAHRRALVTGASSGIGLAFAERLAREGYHLILVARNRERLDTLAARLEREHATKAEALPADLAQADELAIVEEVIAGNSALDLLVNNAGFGTTGNFAELDLDREDEEIRLNVLALTRLTRAALPGMIKRGRGAVINVSSLAGLQPGPFMATYSATKAYIVQFTEALHEELRGTGVQVQALCPGFTRTEFQQRAGIDASKVPSFVWMTAAAVVDASLAALGNGEPVCVPGFTNRALATLGSFIPRGLTRRIIGTYGKLLQR